MTSDRLYRALIRVLPRRVRAEAGDELVEIFRARHARARQNGRAALVRLWAGALIDVLRTAAAEYRGGPSVKTTGRRGSVGKIASDVYAGLRAIVRAPGVPLLATVALASGLAAALVAFIVVRDVLVKPLPFREPERLVRLLELDERGRGWYPAFPNIADWRRSTSAIFEGVAAADPDRVMPVIVGGAAVKAHVMRASAGLFELVGVKPFAGRLFLPEENAPNASPVAVVSWQFWKDKLGGAPLDGLILTVGDAAPTVVGVLPPEFAVPGPLGAFSNADVWTPLERDTALGGRQSHGYTTLARLRPGVTVASATAAMKVVSATLKAQHHETTQADSVRVTPLRDVVVRSAREPMALLMWTAGGVLFAACLNFAATILARGLGRVEELRLRLALGATRGDLLRLLVTEAIAMSLPALLLGLLLTWAATSWLRIAAAGSLPRIANVTVDGSAAAVAGAAALSTAIIASLVPAFALSARTALGRGTRGAIGAPRSTQWLWNAFIAAQIALTFVLLSETGLLLRSFVAAVNVDVGYETDHVLAAELTLPRNRFEPRDKRLAFFRTAADRVRQLPGISAAGLTNLLPFETEGVTASTAVTGRPPTDVPVMMAFRIVETDYFAAAGIPVRMAPEALGAGNTFVDDGVVAKFWPSASPIGDRINNGFVDRPLQVAGIVGGVRQWNEDAGPPGALYVRLGDVETVPLQMALVVRYTGAPGVAMAAVKSAITSTDSTVLVDVQSMDARTAESLRSRRVLMAVAAAFAGTAVLLAFIGTYGMVTFAVRRRLREAAIRLALGAAPSHVRGRFVRVGLGPTLAGIALGAAAARPAAALVSEQLFHVRAGDPVVLAVTFSFLIVSAGIATLLPARRAARVDPTTVLRDQ